MKHIASADRGKLVRVAYKDDTGSVRDMFQQDIRDELVSH